MMMSSLTRADEVTPPHPINSFVLSARVLKRTFQNSHYRVIGSCLWSKRFPPRVEPGAAIEQYLPDLVVTVSNRAGQNPWKEVAILYESPLALKGYQAAFMRALSLPFDNGDSSSQMLAQHLNEERTRIVHVVGSPESLYRLPKITHKPETSFAKLYYSSLADAISDRTESGELAYMATHPSLLLTSYIGTPTNHWGFEIPRLMRVTQTSGFRASVVAAMHAADIVTNKPSAHIARWTSNRCGPNCIIANVIFDPKHQHVIWQEVYPMNRNIQPGDASDMGEADEAKGHGNYVFVLWRKYKGCIKQEGKLTWSTPHVGKPQKR